MPRLPHPAPSVARGAWQRRADPLRLTRCASPVNPPHPDRGRRAEPGELAGRRDRTGRRAPAPEEDRGRRGRPASAARALDGRGDQGRPWDHARLRRLRGGARRLLAGALAAGTRRRGPRHPPVERRGLARAPAGQDRPTRHRAAQARLPRLAARRTGPLQHGRDPGGRGGGRQAPEPGARGPGRRAHPDREPDEERPGPPRRPRLQADPAEGVGAPGGAAHGGGRAAAAEHARRAAPRHGPAAARAGADRGARGGAPRAAAGGPPRGGRRRPPAEDRPHAMVRLLARVVGVGTETADMLVREVLSRELRDRKALARYAGLTGSPDESGARRREKGLARVGNARVRRGMPQLAWRFLRFQADSQLARWYRARTADARGGTRKAMIVALARKLLIALWRLVTTGEAPEGVALRPAA